MKAAIFLRKTLRSDHAELTARLSHWYQAKRATKA